MSAVEFSAQIRAAGQACYEETLEVINLFTESVETLRDLRIPQIAHTPDPHVEVAARTLGEGHANLNNIRSADAALKEMLAPLRAAADQLFNARNDLQRQAHSLAEEFDAAARAVGGGTGG